jgi:uncharacterized protein (DUF2249 family)
MEKYIITPKSKIFDILEAFPELEEVLINYVPEFEKIRNPVLRRTVGKIASLQQAANIGGVNVAELVNHLRCAVGQHEGDLDLEENVYQLDTPVWFEAARISTWLDARPMLEQGEHPVAQVLADLMKLKEGEIYELTVPFLPAPLIDKATSLGFSHWVLEEEAELFKVYFSKA